jgi:hypothetical protein
MRPATARCLRLTALFAMIAACRGTRPRTASSSGGRLDRSVLYTSAAELTAARSP